jgi:hypothetical protein
MGPHDIQWQHSGEQFAMANFRLRAIDDNARLLPVSLFEVANCDLNFARLFWVGAFL